MSPFRGSVLGQWQRFSQRSRVDVSFPRWSSQCIPSVAPTPRRYTHSARPQPRSELPTVPVSSTHDIRFHPDAHSISLCKKRWPAILAFATVGVAGWAGFLLYATNQEKLSSSVVRQIMRAVQQDNNLKALLGDAISPEPAWYLNGDPWISGQVRVSSVIRCFELESGRINNFYW
jgi:cytochrome c oxidase assembly factor 1